MEWVCIVLERLDLANDEPLHMLVVGEGELLDGHQLIMVKRAVDGPEGAHPDLLLDLQVVIFDISL